MPEPRAPASAALRAVVFDLDGTLVDSYAAIAESLNEARRAFAMAPLAELAVRRLVGHGLEALLESQVGARRLDEAVRRFRKRYEEIGVRRTRLLPGVARGLDALARHGLGMAVATNKPARFAGPILASLGISSHFRCVIGPDVAGATKPDPALLRRCLTELAVTPDGAVYVGDMVLDVETADRAGVPVLLIRGGSSSDEDLAATGRPVFASFEELVRHVIDARGAPTPS